MWVYDETKGWFHSPSALAETGIGGADRFPVRINALGLRGPELTLDRAEDAGRVLVFGDSYVFGVGVAEEQILTTHLAHLLAPHFLSGIEVVNLGVAGYSTDQQVLLWQELGSRLSPDVVILVVCDNDYVGNTENFAYRQYYKPYFELEDDSGLHLENVPVPRLSRVQRAKLWLGRESNVWNFVRNRNAGPESAVSTSEARGRRLTTAESALPDNRGPREIVRPRRYHPRRLLPGDEHRQAGGGPGTLPEPLAAARAGGYPSPGPVPHPGRRPESRAGRRLGLSLRPHWNRDAHELAASSLVEYLRDRYLPAEVATTR